MVGPVYYRRLRPGVLASGGRRLAWNRFVRPLGWGDQAVMITYYAAQYCLALSAAAHLL